MALPPTNPPGLVRDAEDLNKVVNGDGTTNRAGDSLPSLKSILGVVESRRDDAILAIDADVDAVDSARGSALSSITSSANQVTSARNSALNTISQAEDDVQGELSDAVERIEQDGRDAAASTGWFVVGEFADGFEFTARNQVGRDADGELWSYNGAELPFTVTAGTVPSEPEYTNRGDAALRSDLADPTQGAAMVARGVAAVESFNALTLLPAGQRRSDLRYLVCGSVFRWDAVKAMFVPEGPVKMAAFGAGSGGDDTDAFQQAASYFNSLGYADIDFEDKSYYINAVYGMNLLDLAYFRTRGTGARITLERQTQVGIRTVFHLARIPYVLAEGIRYTTRVLDNSTPTTDDAAGSRAYLIRATNPNPDAPYGNPGHVFIARNNTFIDEVGVPNRVAEIGRPFNGCIQVSGYGFVRILDNNFINGVGRVCYVNDSSNVVITRNSFKNINYTPFPVSTIQLSTRAIRVLASRRVRIYDNDFEVADENNHTMAVSIVILNDSSQYPGTVCEDVRIFENRIKARNCDDITGVRPIFCRNLKVYGNTFNGKPDAAGSSRFFYIPPTASGVDAYDIQVYENTIDPAYAGVITQPGGAVSRSGEITVYGNHLKFHTAVIDDAIRINGEFEGVLGNKVYLDGELQGDVSGINFYDPNAIGKRRVRISDSNMSDYVDSNGVLELPKDVGVVEFNTTSNVDITDITVGGAKPVMRSMLFYNERTVLTQSPILKHSSNNMRLPGNEDYNLSVAPVRLMYIGWFTNCWMAV